MNFLCNYGMSFLEWKGFPDIWNFHHNNSSVGFELIDLTISKLWLAKVMMTKTSLKLIKCDGSIQTGIQICPSK